MKQERGRREKKFVHRRRALPVGIRTDGDDGQRPLTICWQPPDLVGDMSAIWATSSHSITSSAVARSADGMLRPRAPAALRLIISSYLVGFCTGRSATLAPLRMRSTYSAARG